MAAALREKYPYTEFFSGPYFSAFGLNTERYGVFLRIRSKYGPEKTPNLDNFHEVLVKHSWLFNNESRSLQQHQKN